MPGSRQPWLAWLLSSDEKSKSKVIGSPVVVTLVGGKVELASVKSSQWKVAIAMEAEG